MLPCLLALCIQLGAGMSSAGGQDCGIWYMCGPQYPHQLHLTSPAFSVGTEGRNWRAGYAYLGKFQADATAIASPLPQDVACAPGCYPMSQWHGSGRVGGIYLQYVAHWRGFRAEIGPWFYRATWHETVPDWYVNPASFAAYPQALAKWGAGYHALDVSNDKTSVGAMGGIGYDFGHASAVLQVANAGDRGCDRSIVKAIVATASIRYLF